MQLNELKQMMEDGKNAKDENKGLYKKPLYVYNLMAEAIVDKYETQLDECGFDISVHSNIVSIADRNGARLPVTFKDFRQAIAYIEGVLTGSWYGSNPSL